MKKFLVTVWETLKVLIISLLIILPIRYFLVEPFYVKGASMEPNFFDHEYLVVDRLTYRLDQPSRGEVVVFKYPKDPRQYFIKRIVGLPGETVEIKNDGVYISDQARPEGYKLTENYLSSGLTTTASNPNYTKLTLGEHQYYVMGDNRAESMDSRSFGYVDRSFFVGRVVFRGWPFNRFGVITSPN